MNVSVHMVKVYLGVFVSCAYVLCVSVSVCMHISVCVCVCVCLFYGVSFICSNVV